MITSTSNKQVKHIVQLQKKARMRREENVFIAEGPRMVMETPKDMLQEIYVAESFSENWDGPVDEIVSDAVMKAMSDTQTPQGVLAVVKRPSYTLENILAVRPAHLLLIEEIQDPGNLGTMFRTGEGAGITGVIKMYDMFDYRSDCAFMIGNEGNGLTDATASLADDYLRIPMEGAVESLNAAMAAGILMYEVSRQRRQ